MRQHVTNWMKLAAGATAVLMLASCSFGGGEPSTSGSSGGSATEGGDVSFATPTPSWILPISAPGKTQGENGIFIDLMYPSLLSYSFSADNDYNVDTKRSLAELPTVSDDGLTYTLTLRSRTWSDGTQLTTRDIEFWWNLVSQNKEDWASYREGQFPDNIDEFVVVDDKTVTFTTTERFNPGWFINNQLNRIKPLPAHLWSKSADDEQPGDTDRTSDGSKKIFDYLMTAAEDVQSYATNDLWQTVLGPFKVETYTPNGEVSMVANDAYDGEDKPNISHFIMRPFTSDDAQFNVLRSGGIDYGFIPASAIDQQSQIESKGYTVEPWYGWSITYMPMNFNNPKTGHLFKQKYLRQAMQYLIDQEGISKVVWNDTASPTCGPVPQKPGAAGSMEGCVYNFDPAKAEQLLKDHGWDVKKDGITTCSSPGTGENQCGEGIEAGEELSFNVISQSGFTVTSRMFAEIKSSFSSVGINLDIREVPDSVAESQACAEGDTNCAWDMSFFGSQSSWYYPIYASGERLFQTDAPVNLGSYSDTKADELIEASLRSDDPKALQEYNDYLAEDLPVLWMPNPVNRVSAWKSNIEGISPQDPMLYIYPQDWKITTSKSEGLIDDALHPAATVAGAHCPVASHSHHFLDPSCTPWWSCAFSARPRRDTGTD